MNNTVELVSHLVTPPFEVSSNVLVPQDNCIGFNAEESDQLTAQCRNLVKEVITDIESEEAPIRKAIAVDAHIGNYPEDFISAKCNHNGGSEVEVSFLDLSPFIELDSPLTRFAVANREVTYNDRAYIQSSMLPKWMVNILYDYFKKHNKFPTFTVSMPFEPNGRLIESGIKLSRTCVSLTRAFDDQSATQLMQSDINNSPEYTTLQLIRKLTSQHINGSNSGPISDIGHLKRLAMSHLGLALVLDGYPGIYQAGFDKGIFSMPIYQPEGIVEGFDTVSTNGITQISSCLDETTTLPFYTTSMTPYSPYKHSVRFRADCQLRRAEGIINGHAVDAKISGLDPKSEQMQQLAGYMNQVAAHLNQPLVSKFLKP